MGIQTVLVLDDEKLMRRFLEEALQKKGLSVDAVENGKEGLLLLKKNTYDLVITDMKMPGISGIEVLKKIREWSPQTLVLVMTAFGTIENAVEAMRLGAFNYLLKPFTPDTLEALINKAAEHNALINENIYLREEVANRVQIIAQSPSLKKILIETKRIAKSQASVLIHGESGTGKEVIAGAIHAHSLRAKNPYIRVNCAAVPDTLIESEFFGHEKGAFTGATSKRLGRFELANRGTLLLDEVTEIPLNLQPKLLRVIQEQEFERVGGNRPIPVDFRLISTSNRDLKQAIEAKIFREDLYYRLNVVPIYLPPLRERKEDIIPLIHYFLKKYCLKNQQTTKTLSKSAEKKLLAYPWPGNIRELANLVERIVVMDYSEIIEPTHFSLD
ncbi:MAG: sigma-54 dependent transcriptional regulator [Chlamydiales bacterium]